MVPLNSLISEESAFRDSLSSLLSLHRLVAFIAFIVAQVVIETLEKNTSLSGGTRLSALGSRNRYAGNLLHQKAFAGHFRNKNEICVAIIRPPYKIQTPPDPKIHPEVHPKSSSNTEIQKNTTNTRKNHPISYIFRIFSVFRFWRRIWGVLRGVFWGSEGFCILYGGRMIARFAPFH